jgi:hypothetical protein
VLTVVMLLKLFASTSITVPVLVRVFVVIDGAMRDWVSTVVRLLKLLASTSITVLELVRVLVVIVDVFTFNILLNEFNAKSMMSLLRDLMKFVSTVGAEIFPDSSTSNATTASLTYFRNDDDEGADGAIA